MSVALAFAAGGLAGGAVYYVTVNGRKNSQTDLHEVEATPADEVPTGIDPVLAKRLRRLELLRELNQKLPRTKGFVDVLKKFNDLVTRHCEDMGLSRIRLLYLDDGGAIGTHLTQVAGHPNIAAIESTKNLALRTAAQQVLSEGESVLLEDQTPENTHTVDGQQHAPHRSFLVPVLARGEPLGVLEIEQAENADPLDPADQEFFSLVADQLGSLIENARLIADLSSAEKDARDSENKYRLIAENNSDMIWTVDQIGRYTYLSPAVERILGYTPEEMRSQAALRALTPGPNATLTDHQLRELGIDPRELRRNKNSQMQHRLTRADGTAIWVETQATIIRDENGNSIGFQGVTRDIDERKRGELALLASQGRFKAIFEDAMDAILILRPDQSIVDVNPMGCQLFKRHRDEILALGLGELMMVSEEGGIDLSKPDYFNGKRQEALGVRSNGDLVPIEASIALIETESDEELFLAIIRDISERRESTRRQKVMDRRMRGIVDAADDLLTCSTTELIYKEAVELAKHRLGLGATAIFLREGGNIRGTWGVNEEGYLVDRRKQKFPATEEWHQVFRPQGKGGSRAVYTRLSVPPDTHGALRFPSEEDSLVAQIRNASQQPIALLVTEAPTTEGRDADDLAEVVAIFSSLLGGIVERRLIEDAIKESEERARRAYLAKQREMDKISEVHNRLLPARFEPASGLAFAAQCRPSSDVGGDFYLVHPLADGRVAIAIADVSGHGAKAAVATATSRALIQTALSEAKPSVGPAQILCRVSTWLQEQLDIEQFVTVWLAIWEPQNSTLIYSSAAHHPAVLAKPTGELRYLPQETGLPVGIAGVDAVKPPEQRLKMSVGDRVMLYTDGWVETQSQNGESLEGDHFLAFLAEAEGQPLDQLCLFLFTQFEHFAANTSISDDVTFIAFERVS